MKDKTLQQTKIVAKKNKKLLKNLQAGILKSHGRNNMFLLSLQFNKNKIKKVKKLIANLPITSAKKQTKQAAKANKHTTVTNFYLSFKGYQTLQIGLNTDSNAFIDDMANRVTANEAGISNHILGDNVDEWELPYQENIHAIFSIANDNLSILEKKLALYVKKFKGYLKILQIEKGLTYRNQAGHVMEHFGYVDGVSQPLFFEKDFEDRATNNWNPEAPLNLVLVQDIGLTAPSCYGSYMVFRKLEQNVKSFKEAEHHLAEKLNLVGNTEEAAGAMIIGRFENGLPIVKFGSTSSSEKFTQENNFNYSVDPKGERCPFQAHIRKTNPRGDNERLFGITTTEERSHQILRRGMTYGKRIYENQAFSEDHQPTKGIGLLFICFQNSIENQFEFIQRNWANNNDFPIPFTGIDPIIGHGENRKYLNGKDLEQKWKKSNDKPHTQSLSSFVTMKGGAYFFAPSLPFFKKLKS